MDYFLNPMLEKCISFADQIVNMAYIYSKYKYISELGLNMQSRLVFKMELEAPRV